MLPIFILHSAVYSQLLHACSASYAEQLRFSKLTVVLLLTFYVLLHIYKVYAYVYVYAYVHVRVHRITTCIKYIYVTWLIPSLFVIRLAPIQNTNACIMCLNLNSICIHNMTYVSVYAYVMPRARKRPLGV